MHCYSPRLLLTLFNVVLLSRSSSTDYSPVSDVSGFARLSVSQEQTVDYMHVSKL